MVDAGSVELSGRRILKVKLSEEVQHCGRSRIKFFSISDRKRGFDPHPIRHGVIPVKFGRTFVRMGRSNLWGCPDDGSVV